MSEKTALWDRLGRTDPAHTKAFTRGGGFKGTAIKPMWSYRRMTEEFGPIGQGWGIYEPSFQVVPGTDGETLVYCTVSIWYEKPEQRSWGVGGDKVIAKFSSGTKSDDEAFKKAFTDAITNALKMIGVGADVHMGMFDDSKYVNEVGAEFRADKQDKQKPASPIDPRSQTGVSEGETNKPASAAQQKRALIDIENDMLDCETIAAVNKCAGGWKHIAQRDGWSKDYITEAAKKFEARRKILQEADVFPGDLPPSVQSELRNHPLNAG
jgi:hypothetical protein